MPGIIPGARDRMMATTLLLISRNLSFNEIVLSRNPNSNRLYLGYQFIIHHKVQNPQIIRKEFYLTQPFDSF